MTPKRGRIPGVTKDSVGWLKSFKISYLDTTGSRQLDKTIKKKNTAPDVQYSNLQ